MRTRGAGVLIAAVLATTGTFACAGDAAAITPMVSLSA